MTNQTTLEGKWDQAQGRIKEAWGALTDDDLQRTEGKWDRLVGTVRERTGEAIETIEAKLNSILDGVEDAGSSDDS